MLRFFWILAATVLLLAGVSLFGENLIIGAVLTAAAIFCIVFGMDIISQQQRDETRSPPDPRAK